MLFALSSLIDGSKMRYHNRSYKALHRRGLVTEDFLVTPEGLSVYAAYCQLGPSVPELMEEHRQNYDGLLATQTLINTCPTCGQFTFLEHAPIEPTNPKPLATSIATVDEIDHADPELRRIVDCWPNLPVELRKLIAETATRIAQ
jgi:hypothetical protein